MCARYPWDLVHPEAFLAFLLLRLLLGGGFLLPFRGGLLLGQFRLELGPIFLGDDVTNAFRTPAKAGMILIVIEFETVVEGEFVSFLDVS